MSEQRRSVGVAIIGAGLVGSLLSLYLSRRGMRVDVFERRSDMRKENISAGRSINLNISCRGLLGLAGASVLEKALSELVPMTGRLMHARDGSLTYQPYGRDDTEYGNSVSRAGLNKLLMNEAESTGLVEFHFGYRALAVDFESNEICFALDDGNTETVEAGLIFGGDGCASAIRSSIKEFYKDQNKESVDRFTQSISPLDYGYKELYIPPAEGGGFRIDGNVLHIWPRGTYMVIALPNFDGSFTVTLFLPLEGDPSFSSLDSESKVMQFFEEQFADTLPLITGLAEEFASNPTGHMETVKCGPWHVGGKALILGDAAHAVVPFFGQGMNCGFEDLSVLDKLMNQFDERGESLVIPGKLNESKRWLENSSTRLTWEKLFAEFYQERKDNCDAIADMAVENFVEMRDKVADPEFLMRKSVEKILATSFPGRYYSRYQLVTFTNLPYKLALEAGMRCDTILEALCNGICDPEKIDLQLAERLINEQLTPLLSGRPELTTVAG